MDTPERTAIQTCLLVYDVIGFTRMFFFIHVMTAWVAVPPSLHPPIMASCAIQYHTFQNIQVPSLK